MRYCRTATFLSHGSTREVIPPCTAWLGIREGSHTGDVGQASSICGPLWTRIYMCSFSALGTRWRQGPLLFLLILSGSANRWSSGFWNELPQTQSATACACIGGFGITWALQSVPHSSCHDFTQASLALADPACCGFHLTTQVSFLLCYTPCLKATFYTLVTGRFHEDSSTASLCIYVYTVTGDPQMGDWICISVATGLQPWKGENMFPLAATDAGLILGALKLSLCGFKAVAEKHYFKISLILYANRALGVFCTDHSFGWFFFFLLGS